MRALLKTLGNAALVVGGFFAILFGVSRVTTNVDRAAQANSNDFGVAYADAPYSQSSYGDSGDCGYSCGGDCGGDCGCDGGK
jgi:hypothetical protein